VLTHGFTVDEKGRKMSKSLGNVIAPQKVMKTLGADVLRLWVAATDYANEMSVSDEILKRMSDSYRRIRNTARFLLGNLAASIRRAMRCRRRSCSRSTAGRWRARQRCSRRSSRPTQLRVPPDLPEGAQLLRRGPRRLLPRRHQGPPVHHAGRQPGAPLGADGDVHIAEAMVRWLAPILSFTAEEIWPLRGKCRGCRVRQALCLPE
jgi:isoleucyl-tRNA synthetase